MGHKVHPKIHRTQVIYTWDSKWFGGKEYALFARQDIRIRAYLLKKFKDAHIDSISIERGPKNMAITMLAAKPGFVIGRGGKGLDDVRKYIETRLLQMRLKVRLNVRELRSPALSAAVVGQTIATEIERRIPFRRTMKQSAKRVMEAGAKGIKIQLSGRLNGAEIARTEKIAEGTLPLITLRSDVDYALTEAHTIYGIIGIKVWVGHGEVFGRKDAFAGGNDEEQAEKKSKKKRT